MIHSKCITILLLLGTVFSLIGQSIDQSQSPYFAVDKNTDLEAFPLLSSYADVTITGPIADVSITQSYTNNGTTPIEAIYVFPASTRAAVYSMEMKVGKRTIVADIQKKKEARANYERAKVEGKRASLLEQHRPNVFQMNVGNIMPGDKIELEMKYTEFILPEDQQYSFVYPTVVGPRYTGEEAASFAGQPYTKSSELPSYDFGIDVHLNMPVQINQLTSPSHETLITKRGKSARIETKSSDKKAGNRDFIVHYKLSDIGIQSGLMTYDHGDESFFLCQVEPPALETCPEITPREYIFVLDVSGSMMGFPMDVSKVLMKNLFAGMTSYDKFNVMFFAGSAAMMHQQSVSATPSNIKKAFTEFNNMKGGGGTNMLKAINKALAIPKEKDYSRSFVIVTDGYVSVEEKTYTTIQKNLGSANFFAFGIGSSVNRSLIEGIAHVGGGTSFIVTEQKYALKEANKLKKYIESPMLTNIKYSGTGIELYDVIPEHIPDLMGARPIYLFGKYKNNRDGHITINGNRGGKPFSRDIRFPETNMVGNKGLAYLWAREKIRFLDDFNGVNHNAERVEEVTSLGLKYNLLTKYTSFVAIDDKVVNDSGKSKSVKQTLPMPQGVSNSAIGFEMELPELLSYDSKKTRTIKVNVLSKDQITNALFDALLEKHFKTLDKDLLNGLVGKTIQVKIDKALNVSLSCLNIDLKDLELLLAKDLKAIGSNQLERHFEIRIE